MGAGPLKSIEMGLPEVFIQLQERLTRVYRLRHGREAWGRVETRVVRVHMRQCHVTVAQQEEGTVATAECCAVQCALVMAARCAAEYVRGFGRVWHRAGTDGFVVLFTESQPGEVENDLPIRLLVLQTAHQSMMPGTPALCSGDATQ